MTRDNMVFIDWGTSKAAAYLVDGGGRILDSRTSQKGIKFVPAGGYPTAYEELTQGWLDSSRFTLLSGMVGSANGWEEAPYIALPANPVSIADRVYAMKSMPGVYICGGLCYTSPEGLHDVIRGEEVQILGLSVDEPGKKFLICMPGTHSKWLTMDHERIDAFTTVMSGDFFAAVTTSTIIAMMLQNNEQEFSDEAFLSGVKIAQGPGGVMSHMFRTRSSFLFKELDKKHIKAFASGVIIGSEIASMKELYPFDRTVEIIASSELGANYALALKSLGAETRAHNAGDLSVKGMYLVAKHIKA
ncbi:MAG: 2-dehydro-3-deoxygalactonokinase [Methylobacteriaceae bacterium]|jgi:2-dehydro-3-deoxygalactonokinase|nr:2-dehydro-3-deoxygalactonokinase [Methylobacteriaceae bacterium]